MPSVSRPFVASTIPEMSSCIRLATLSIGSLAEMPAQERLYTPEYCHASIRPSPAAAKRPLSRRSRAHRRAAGRGRNASEKAKPGRLGGGRKSRSGRGRQGEPIPPSRFRVPPRVGTICAMARRPHPCRASLPRTLPMPHARTTRHATPHVRQGVERGEHGTHSRAHDADGSCYRTIRTPHSRPYPARSAPKQIVCQCNGHSVEFFRVGNAVSPCSASVYMHTEVCDVLRRWRSGLGERRRGR